MSQWMPYLSRTEEDVKARGGNLDVQRRQAPRGDVGSKPAAGEREMDKGTRP
jgi:hypothetical protein